MKPAIFYALRQIRRRWRDDLPILLLCAAVMLSLLLLLMAMEGSWQARVLPDRAENYHFILYDLTPQEAAEIAARPNVQAVYYCPIRPKPPSARRRRMRPASWTSGSRCRPRPAPRPFRRR